MFASFIKTLTNGLYELTLDQIIETLGPGAALDIWNSVISGIKVPDAYQNGDEK